MSSGHKRVKQNTREKWLSTDFNRSQAFQGAAIAELFRYLFNTQPTTALDVGSAFQSTSVPSTIEAPLNPGLGLRADVWDGLMVLPQVGSLDLLIMPGVVGIHDPDGQTGSSNAQSPNPDDSPYKVIRDPGISIAGALVIATNTSGSVRVDMIECRRHIAATLDTSLDDTVLEQDNRDEYDTGTGGFTPTLVDKVLDGRLDYRVRQGTPGAGLPALAVGWLPLAVVSVPNNTTVNHDACTFWDVRPCVRDRTLAPFRGVSGLVAPFRKQELYVDVITNGAQARVMGVAEIEEPTTGNLAGGKLIFDGDATPYIDTRAAANQSPGFAPLAMSFYYLWALFPLGLPRWVKYATLSGQRVPFGPKGIIVASTVAPTIGHGVPASLIAVPAATGLSTSTLFGVVLAVLPTTTLGVPAGAIVDGEWTYPAQPATILGPTTLTPGSLSSDEYLMVAGTHFPPNARALKVKVVFVVNGATADAHYRMTSFVVNRHTSGVSTNVAQAHIERIDGQVSAAGTMAVGRSYEVPRIPPFAPGPGANMNIFINWALTVVGSPVKSAEFLEVLAWKLGG